LGWPVYALTALVWLAVLAQFNLYSRRADQAGFARPGHHPPVARRDDPRVARLGRFLRRFGPDELRAER